MTKPNEARTGTAGSTEGIPATAHARPAEAVANPITRPPVRASHAVRVLAAYVRWKARSGLDGVFVTGLSHVRAATAAAPVLFACTHSAWWDGLLVRLIEVSLDLDGLVTMDGETLALNPYFRWFGVRPLYPTGLAALAGLKRLTGHLDSPGRCVWYFPQGRHRPTSVRPLGVLPGVAFMAKTGRFTVIPVSIHYDFRLAPVPTAVLVFGAPVEPTIPDLEAALQTGHDQACGWFDGAALPLDVLVPPRSVSAEDGFGARLLRWLTR